MQSEERAAGASQITGIQRGANVFKLLFTVRRTKWSALSKWPGLPQRLQRLIILLRGSEIAGFQILPQLLEIRPAMVKEAF
jgi:hypothetical protein